MRQFELVETVQSYDPTADVDLIDRAYVFALRAHRGQKRASGEPYVTHPQAVAEILTEMRLDDATISAALLHDVVEDTPATVAEISELFGDEIADLVDGLTKIKQLDLVTKKAEQAENFRKLLLAFSSDIRVLLVKLADRLHNMRTLGIMREEKRRRIAEETLDIYAPLAGRMGMQGMRDELEALSFQYAEPEAHEAIVARLDDLQTRNAGLIEEVKAELEERLRTDGIVPVVSGREKRPYAIWRKMEDKHLDFEQLSDMYAFRVVVRSVADCYRILGLVHTTWPAVPGRFKDYISVPKQNDYQSLHTTVIGPRNQRVELQIRTERMNEIAEYGVAAHTLYKERTARDQDARRPALEQSNAYAWLRRHAEAMLSRENSAEDVFEHTRLELFHDQVFCFTPKGRIIALPRGATAIDFAYAVHTDVGNRCVGCKINRRPAPATTVLQNGQEVEIICSDKADPPAAWEQIAVTGRARSAIRRGVKENRKRQYGELGRHILTNAFAKIDEAFSDEKIASALHRLTQKSVDDVVVAVARGELAAAVVVRAVFPSSDLPAEPKPPRRARNRLEGAGAVADDGWFNLRNFFGLKFRVPGSAGGARTQDPTGLLESATVPIRGVANLPVSFAEGGAVPGDRIVGIVTPGVGISVFPIHSPLLELYESEPERWMDVTWDMDASPERFPSRLNVTALNEPGSLARIASLIGEEDANIDNLMMLRREADFTEMQIDLEVWDLGHLNTVMRGLRAIPVVHRVARVFATVERTKPSSP